MACDDVKASCKDGFEITKLFSYLNNIYDNKVAARRAKKGDYLGMIFDYTEPGIFQIDMMAYIKTIFEDFPEEITRSSPTPASDHFF